MNNNKNSNNNNTLDLTFVHIFLFVLSSLLSLPQDRYFRLTLKQEFLLFIYFAHFYFLCYFRKKRPLFHLGSILHLSMSKKDL